MEKRNRSDCLTQQKRKPRLASGASWLAYRLERVGSLHPSKPVLKLMYISTIKSCNNMAKNTTATTKPQIGEDTHHHDQAITPDSLSPMKSHATASQTAKVADTTFHAG
jgi:hypothetical protein